LTLLWILLSAKRRNRNTELKEQEEEDYKLWPANKSEQSPEQSLSNSAKRHFFMSN